MDADVPKDAQWDRERLKDLGYGDKESVPSTFARTMLNGITVQIQNGVDAAKLAPHLQHRGLIDPDQFQQLTGSDTPKQKSLLLIRILNKRIQLLNAHESINEFYLSLLDSFEHDVTLGCHRDIAVHMLRPRVLETLQKEDPDKNDLRSSISRVKPLHLNESVVVQLKQNLGLDNANVTDGIHTASQVCLEWFQMKSQPCCLADLVEALMYTPGLGKLVSRLSPPYCSNTPDVCKFIKTLHVHWKQFASNLGYTEDDVSSIVKRSYGGTDGEIRTFLRVWCMPDCGGRTRDILEEVKRRAGIHIPGWDAASQMKIGGIHHSDGASVDVAMVPFQMVRELHHYYYYADARQWGPPRSAMGYEPQMALPGPRPYPPREVSQYQFEHDCPLPKESSMPTEYHPKLQKGSAYRVESPVSPQEEVQMKSTHLHITEVHDGHPSTPSMESCPVVPEPSESCTSRDDIRNDGMALLAACMSGEWDMAEALVHSGSYMDAKNQEDGKTPLMYACIKGKTDLVKLLLSKGADLSAVDKRGYCCLHFQDVQKKQDLMEFLINTFIARDVSVDLSAVENGYTPLMVACTISDSVAHVAELLLQNGARPDGDPQAYRRPLIEASSRGHSTLVALLLTYGANPDTPDRGNDHTPSTKPIVHENHVLLSSSLQRVAHPEMISGMMAWLCLSGEWDMAEALVHSGSYMDAKNREDGKTPLMYACIKGKTDLVKLLLSKGADLSAVDKRGYCCLHFQDVQKKQDLMEFLINTFIVMDVSVDLSAVENGYTPLMVACTISDSVAHVAELLLQNGARPDGDPQAYSRPLIEASSRGHSTLVGLLLTYGANPDTPDRSRCTALLQACRCRQPSIATLLLEHNASVHRSDDDGTTPLFSAVESNSYHLVQQLILKGANVNTTRYMTNPVMGGSVQETPLAHACARGFQDIAELLIQNKANVNFLCSGTVPPIGFAIICKQMHIVRFLLKNNDLDRTLRGLSGPVIIAVRVENYQCARILLKEIGGVEKALMKANENQLYQLAESIEICIAMSKSLPDQEQLQDLPNPVPPQMLSSDRGRVEEVLQCFCQICVSALVNNQDVAQDVVISTATTLGNVEVSSFLTRCYNNSQSQESLRQDFLGGDPSPAMFLVQNGILKSDDFQIEALNFHGNPEKFYSDLIKAFQQIPGGQNLPDDIQVVLQRFFSGQLNVGVHVGILGAGRTTHPPIYQVPHTCNPTVHPALPHTLGASSPESSSGHFDPTVATIGGIPLTRDPQASPRSQSYQSRRRANQSPAKPRDLDLRTSRKCAGKSRTQQRRSLQDTSAEVSHTQLKPGHRPKAVNECDGLPATTQMDKSYPVYPEEPTYTASHKPDERFQGEEAERDGMPVPHVQAMEECPHAANVPKPDLNKEGGSSTLYHSQQTPSPPHDSNGRSIPLKRPDSTHTSLRRQSELTDEDSSVIHSSSCSQSPTSVQGAHSFDSKCDDVQNHTPSIRRKSNISRASLHPVHQASTFHGRNGGGYGRYDSGYGPSPSQSFDVDCAIEIGQEEVRKLLCKIAEAVENWEELANYLLIAEEILDFCKRTYTFRQEQCFKMLENWVRSQQGRATFGQLKEALNKVGRQDLCQLFATVHPSAFQESTTTAPSGSCTYSFKVEMSQELLQQVCSNPIFIGVGSTLRDPSISTWHVPMTQQGTSVLSSGSIPSVAPSTNTQQSFSHPSQEQLLQRMESLESKLNRLVPDQ